MKIDGKICWLLFTVVLLVVLLPQPTLAQEEKVDLTLRLVPVYYSYEVTAGKDNTFFLEVRNTGSKAITD